MGGCTVSSRLKGSRQTREFVKQLAPDGRRGGDEIASAILIQFATVRQEREQGIVMNPKPFHNAV